MEYDTEDYITTTNPRVPDCYDVDLYPEALPPLKEKQIHYWLDSGEFD